MFRIDSNLFSNGQYTWSYFVGFLLRRLYSFAITLRLPSVYVEIHLEFFVRSFVSSIPLTLLPGQNRSRSDCNVRSSNGRRRPKTMIVDETEGRGWDGSEMETTRDDQRAWKHPLLFRFFNRGDLSLLRYVFSLIYLHFQKKRRQGGWYRRAGDFRDSVVSVGINSALTKGRRALISFEMEN